MPNSLNPARHPTNSGAGASSGSGSATTTTTSSTGTAATAASGTAYETALASWLDGVVASGTVTATAQQQVGLQAAADRLSDTIDAGGTELAPGQEKLLGSIAHDLRQVASSGDRTVNTGSTEYPTLLGQVESRLEGFLDHQSGLLSAEANTRLESALDTLETVYADGVVSTEELAAVDTAADAVCGVLRDDFTKLSTAGLEQLQGFQADLTTLATTGTLTLDATELAAVTAADTALHAFLNGGGTDAHATAIEAVADLRDVLPGAIVDLASLAGGGRRGPLGYEIFAS